MGHNHPVVDTDDKYFIINPATRTITNETSKTILIKNDHNSEEFTFEIPRFVEGHDMSTSTRIEVHFINISSKNRDKSSGVYEVENIKVEGDKLTFKWLISNAATKYAGSLNFAIRFACLTGDIVDYAWNTGIYTGISISDGLSNSGEELQDYVDFLQSWYNKFLALSDDLYAVTDEGTILNFTEMIRTEKEERKADVVYLNDKISKIDTAEAAKPLIQAAVKAEKDERTASIQAEKEARESAINNLSNQLSSDIAGKYLEKNHSFDRVYKSFADLGLESNPLTIEGLINVILSKNIVNSLIIISNYNNSTLKDMPEKHGCLYICVPSDWQNMIVQYFPSISKSDSKPIRIFVPMIQFNYEEKRVIGNIVWRCIGDKGYYTFDLIRPENPATCIYGRSYLIRAEVDTLNTDDKKGPTQILIEKIFNFDEFHGWGQYDRSRLVCVPLYTEYHLNKCLIYYLEIKIIQKQSQCEVRWKKCIRTYSSGQSYTADISERGYYLCKLY